MRIFLMLVFLSVDVCLYSQDNQNINQNIKEKYTNVLKKIKVKMNKIIRPGKTKPHAAVIGVRGNKYDIKNGIYWKTELSEKMKEKIKKDSQEAEKIINSLINGADVSSLSSYIKENSDNYFLNEIKEIYTDSNSINDK